ncbi:MAG: peptide chain release factor N(5)-glutamine methyltransferase [Actinobacteria bacterium]|nr:peptide chain release factor N(5)-glutamine methyltransferase [Actinomycetota bacterium]
MTSRSTRDLLRQAQEKLAAAGVASPRVDAEIFMAHALGVSRGQLLTHAELSRAQSSEFTAAVARRVLREPVQHIIGQAWFRHLTLAVGSGVFVPRPETETLVELALAELNRARAGVRDRSVTVVDLCTGSAAIPLAIATEAGNAEVYGVELSADALRWATLNVASHEDQLRVADSSLTLIEADAATAIDAVRGLRGAVDVLTCNPPYIPDAAIPRDQEVRDFDPGMALFGGADGLAVVRAVIDQAAEFLVDGGYLLIEHGDEQGVDGGELGVPHLVASSPDFTQVQDHPDLAGRPRVTTARRDR